MGFDLGSLLQQYAGSNPANHAQAENDFDQVAQNAPQSHLAEGVSEALRSDQTPPFPQVVGRLFNQGNSGQRAGMLNQLFGGHGNANADVPQLTPQQASAMTPEQVQEIAAKAEQDNPGIVDRMGALYAEHPQLVKGLGGAALAMVLGRMAQGKQR